MNPSLSPNHPVPDLFSCPPGREGPLLDELQRAQAHAPHLVAPGWVASGRPQGQPLSLAFASQVWPAAEALQAASVNAWAALLAQRIQEALADHLGPWRLQLFCHDIPEHPLRQRRLQLIEKELQAVLKKKQRRLLRTQIPDGAPWQKDEIVVQVGLHTPNDGHFAIVAPPTRKIWRHVLSRFAGGIAPVEEDRRPPARAYLKLLEAQKHMGRGPGIGETCVDLGASPGSWSFVALEQGAIVTAIDRSPLRDDLMDNPHLHFVQGDAFKYRPEQPVDWLVCDVIAYPERILALLRQWLAEKWCRRFVVTIKFRGDADYYRVEECKDILRDLAKGWRLRALAHNKNEVTAFGRI